MESVEVFEKFAERYDSWFDRNPYAYKSELKAISALIPKGKGIEIGVGTGRFAKPLGIKFGIEPSRKMAEIARKRGIEVVEGFAENLPVENESFDFALLVTVICFVKDVEKTFSEVRRILRRGGYIILGFIDGGSELGKKYMERRKDNVFYRVARLYTTEEILKILTKHKFGEFKILQTIFSEPENMMEEDEVKEGYGKGMFVALRGKKML